MEPSFHILLLKYKCLSWRFLVDACLNCKCNYCPANLSHYFFTQNSQPACVNGPLGNPSNLNDSVIHGQVSSIINFLHSFDLRLMGFLLDMFIHDQFFFFLQCRQSLIFAYSWPNYYFCGGGKISLITLSCYSLTFHGV